MWEEDQELILAKIPAQLELLTKYIMGGPTNMTSHISQRVHYKKERSRGVKEENWYLGNLSGESYSTYHKQDENKGWKIMMMVNFRERGDVSVTILFPTVIDVLTKSQAPWIPTKVERRISL